MADARTFTELLGGLRRIIVPAGSPAVCTTVAREIHANDAPRAVIADRGRAAPATLRIRVGQKRGGAPGVNFTVDERGFAELSASKACWLYAWFRYLVEAHGDAPVRSLANRRADRPAFEWQRPVWDLYFAQAARSIRNLDRESYVAEMARLGFTHLEVNSLAFPEGIEEGVPGEVYPRFYTYCPALDQFVTSFLNDGVYPRRYLRANLKRLRENCALAERYGLIPTMTSFEPRSVPESLLAKYPELRGARVDHPFRSFKPRYNLAVAHPVVQRHYRELMQNLMRAVPALGCLSVWTNDSGAGFEFTRSLYVGANGSAYLVREWSAEDVFARAAADNVVGFLRLLQDTAVEVNPDFRVVTRLEPFGAERERIVENLGRGLDVEVPTLLETGWDSPYGHPRYDDCTLGPFTVYNHEFRAAEEAPMRALAKRDCRTHVVHAHGPVNNFEPLLGIPTPGLTHEKLRALHRTGVDYLAHVGGAAPPAAVPWNLNQEVFRRFQFDPRMKLDRTIEAVARDWTDGRHTDDLVRAWRLAEEAIRAFMPDRLYFSWGVWYRILVRPLVPDIEAIPESERAYYEKHLLSTHHNPNRCDLARDVLFQLTTPALARRTVSRIDKHALRPLAEAVALLWKRRTDAPPILADQADRLAALHCWFVTHRNVAAWTADVHGCLRTRSEKARAACRERLQQMITSEIANAKTLLKLWESSDTEFMAVADGPETTFIYDENFGDHVREKIRLMQRYRRRAPKIDEDIMWRVNGLRGE